MIKTCWVPMSESLSSCVPLSCIWRAPQLIYQTILFIAMWGTDYGQERFEGWGLNQYGHERRSLAFLCNVLSPTWLRRSLKQSVSSKRPRSPRSNFLWKLWKEMIDWRYKSASQRANLNDSSLNENSPLLWNWSIAPAERNLLPSWSPDPGQNLQPRRRALRSKVTNAVSDN